MTLRIAFAGAAALVLAASSSAAAPRPARPSAIPPAPLSSLHGRIVYSIRDGDIWVVNADGSKRRRITRSGRATTSILTPHARAADRRSRLVVAGKPPDRMG